MQGVGRQDVVISRFDGIQLVSSLLLCDFVVHGHNTSRAVFLQRCHCFGRQDACLVHFGQFLFDILQVVGCQIGGVQAVLVVLFQFFQGFSRDILILLIVGLEAGQDTVLLVSDHVVRFVDRKVEGSYQLAVFPGFVDVKLIVELPVTGQEVDDDCYRTDEKKGFV